MGLGRTITAHQSLIQPIADKYPHVTIVAPAVTNGPPPNGIQFMKDFLGGCSGCRIDAVATHWYGAADIENFKNHITSVHNESGGKAVWVTEFASWEGDEQFLKDAMAWMDSVDFVHRYAYFSVEASMTAGMSLNNLGNTFANA